MIKVPKKTVNILVIEDTEKHLQSAKEQFIDYTVTLSENYEDGKKFLETDSYDVLLTDLLMPKGNMETMGQEGMKYIFDLLPFGFPLALLAAKKGIKYIGIVTDVNHHDHPMSAAIDPISGAYWSRSDNANLYKLNDSIFGVFHAPFTADNKKDWNKVLEVLQT